MTTTSPTSKECPIIECMRPECIPQCAPVSWFGNLSDCDVTLQYQAHEGSLWHSLGEYPAGMHTELGGGALFLPQTVNIRVIETPKVGSTEEKHPRVIQNWGVLGTGLRSLYIDNTMCSHETSLMTSPSSSPITTVQKQCPTQKKQVPPWLIDSTWIVLVLAILVSGFLIWKFQKKK